MCFVYADKYGIVHAVKDESTAKEVARGEIIQCPNLAFGGGYLKVKDKHVFIDVDDKTVYVGGNKGAGHRRDFGDLPFDIQEVAIKLGF